MNFENMLGCVDAVGCTGKILVKSLRSGWDADVEGDLLADLTG